MNTDYQYAVQDELNLDHEAQPRSLGCTTG